jgi:hypothetical protein
MDITQKDALFIEMYVHSDMDRVLSYAKVYKDIDADDFDKLPTLEKVRLRELSRIKWREIESKLGGASGLLEVMGLDTVSLLKKTRELAMAVMPVYVNGELEWHPDNKIRVQALKILHDVFGTSKASDMDKLAGFAIAFDPQVKGFIEKMKNDTAVEIN